MKRIIINTVVVSIMFGITVFTTGYLLLDSRLNEISASENVNSVPYYQSIPKNTSVLMKICQDEILLNFDFEQEILNVIFIGESSQYYDYVIDYTILCDYNTVGYLADSVGGVQLGEFRYTGVQITEMLEYSNLNIDEKCEIAKKIIDGIAKAGFTKESLLYIINTGETDLKFNECFSWVEFIPELCKFPRFVN